MRPIDADALLAIYKKWIPQLSFFKDDAGDKRGVETCIAVLEDAPTLSYKDLVPQGEWLWFGKRGIYGDMYACSECHAKYDGQSPFCPNCGARMTK